MNRDNKQNGFTLIELLLSMIFVSILLLAVAMTVIQISNIYNKGLTLKDVNQAGRSLTENMQSTISSSSPFNVLSGAGSQYIQQEWGGRLCTGQYTYVWNYGAAISRNDPNRLNTFIDSLNKIKFIKVYDPSGSYCQDSSLKIQSSSSSELLGAGEHDLVLHYFLVSSDVNAYDSRTNQRLYSIRFVIGTNNQNAITTNPSGEIVCKTANQSGSDPSFCAVSRFDIVALAGNSVE